MNEFTPSVYVVANHILGGTMTLTQGMAIRSEDGTVQFTSQGIEIDSVDHGSTLLSPGGLVFNRPDGSRSGYVRAIVARRRTGRGVRASELHQRPRGHP